MSGRYFDIRPPQGPESQSPRPVKKKEHTPASHGPAGEAITKNRFIITKVTGALIGVTLVALLTISVLSAHKVEKSNNDQYKMQGGEVVLGGQAQINTAEARDNRRYEDLQRLKFALELYRGYKDKYPATDGLQRVNQPGGALEKTLLAEKYLMDLPRDPLFPDQDYWYESDGQTFRLIAYREINASQAQRLYSQPVYIVEND